MFRWISVELLPPGGGQQNLHRSKLDNSTYLILLCANTYHSSYISVEKDDYGDPERKEKKCCKSFKKKSGKKMEVFLGHLTEQLQRTAVRHVQKKQRVH